VDRSQSRESVDIVVTVSVEDPELEQELLHILNNGGWPHLIPKLTVRAGVFAIG